MKTAFDDEHKKAWFWCLLALSIVCGQYTHTMNSSEKDTSIPVVNPQGKTTGIRFSNRVKSNDGKSSPLRGCSIEDCVEDSGCPLVSDGGEGILDQLVRVYQQRPIMLDKAKRAFSSTKRSKRILKKGPESEMCQNEMHQLMVFDLHQKKKWAQEALRDCGTFSVEDETCFREAFASSPETDFLSNSPATMRFVGPACNVEEVLRFANEQKSDLSSEVNALVEKISALHEPFLNKEFYRMRLALCESTQKKQRFEHVLDAQGTLLFQLQMLSGTLQNDLSANDLTIATPLARLYALHGMTGMYVLGLKKGCAVESYTALVKGSIADAYDLEEKIENNRLLALTDVWFPEKNIEVPYAKGRSWEMLFRHSLLSRIHMRLVNALDQHELIDRNNPAYDNALKHMHASYANARLQLQLGKTASCKKAFGSFFATSKEVVGVVATAHIALENEIKVVA